MSTVSDGNEANGAAPVTDDHTAHPREPHIHVLKGQPTDAELAALVTVLGGLGAAAPEPTQPESTRWGLAVDRLRYAMSNFQRLTMQQMTHMRH